MQIGILFRRVNRVKRTFHLTAFISALVLLLQPTLGFVSAAHSAEGAGKKSATMSEDQRIAHILSRLTFGARPGDFEKVKAMGVDRFITEQLDPDSIDNITAIAKLKKLPTLGMATPVIIEQYTPPKPVASPSPSPAQPAEKSKAAAQIAAEQMPAQKNLSDNMPALMASESAKSVPDVMQKPGENTQTTNPAPPEIKKENADRTTALPSAKPSPPPKNPQMVVTELQRAKLLRAVYSEQQLYELMVDFWENHFSIFANKDDDRYLLTSFDRDTIRPFAMGRFRDLLGVTAHSPAMLYYLDNWRSSVPRPYAAKDGKPAGVDGGFNENYARELMELHTLGVAGGYTQKDVQEVARCFSGWTILKPNEQGLFLYRPGFHDDGEKVVLGHRILSGGGMADGERVLDILAAHPATARFIATKLARRFISDNPPQSVIDRAAAVFLKTDGSLRETLRAIVTSPEFFAQSAYRAKMRSPFEYVCAAMRALNAETDGDRPVLDAVARMGQPVFGRITPDGFSDRAEQWLSSGAMVARLNFASALATGRIKGTKIDLGQLLSGIDPEKRDEVISRLMRLTFASAATRAELEKILASPPPSGAVIGALPPPANLSANYTGNDKRAQSVPPYLTDLVTLLIGSPEFQQR